MTAAARPLALAFDAIDKTSSHTATPLLILHGLFGSKANWRSIATDLAATWPIFTLDLRNHGASPWADDMRYASLAADIVDFIRRQNFARVHLLGHSLGGKVAMAVAQLHSAHLQKLVVADIAPVAYPRSPLHAQYIDALRGVDLHQHRSRAAVDAALGAAIAEPAIRQFLLQNLQSTGAAAPAPPYRWRLNLAALAANLTTIGGYGINPPTSTPTLCINGAESDYVLPQHQYEIDTRFTHWQQHTIADTAHWLHAEKPQQFTNAVREFLSR